MNTHESYVSLETAKLLKEAGFDWKQYSFYNSKSILINGTFNANWNDKIWNIDGNKVSAPTLDIAQRWLREVKEHHICISFLFANNHKYYAFLSKPSKRGYLECDCGWIENEFDTYEEAQEFGIRKALEMILEKGE